MVGMPLMKRPPMPPVAASPMPQGRKCGMLKCLFLLGFFKEDSQLQRNEQEFNYILPYRL